MPPKITASISEPDELIIKFKESDIFMDKKDFSTLSEDLIISAKIPP